MKRLENKSNQKNIKMWKYIEKLEKKYKNWW